MSHIYAKMSHEISDLLISFTGWTREDRDIMRKMPGAATARNLPAHLSDAEIMTQRTCLGNLPPAVKTTLLELSDLT